MSDSLQPHWLQHARPPYPLPTPRVSSNSCPLSQWSHPTISFSVVPFFSCLQSFLASGSFQISHFFTSGGQSIGVSASASVLPGNIQASGPITSWQIDEETMKTVTDFIFLGSKITADGDCSHEIKRHLLLERKAMTNLHSILQSRDIILLTKVGSSQSYCFSSSHVQM